MGRWGRLAVAGLGAVSLVGAGTTSVGAHGEGRLLEFESMTPVTGAAVGAVNDRGLVGGGKPWAITSGTGEVDRDGNVEVTVTGLVIPVAPFNSTNPVGAFKAIVSCVTKGGIVNVSTGTFPASAAGNAAIHARVSLPRHCKHPIVFVTSPGGAWFAMSNRDDEDDD